MTEKQKNRIKLVSNIFGIIASIIFVIILFINFFKILENIFLFILSIFSRNVKFNELDDFNIFFVYGAFFLPAYLFVKYVLKYDFLSKKQMFGFISILLIPIFLLSNFFTFYNMVNFYNSRQLQNTTHYAPNNLRDNIIKIDTTKVYKSKPLNLIQKIDSQIVKLSKVVRNEIVFKHQNDSIFVNSILEYLMLDTTKYKSHFSVSADLLELKNETHDFLLESLGENVKLKSKFDTLFENMLIGKMGNYNVSIAIDKQIDPKFKGKITFSIDDDRNISEPHTFDILEYSKYDFDIEGIILNNGFIHFSTLKDIYNPLNNSTFNGFVKGNSIQGQWRALTKNKIANFKFYSVPLVQRGMMMKKAHQTTTLTIKDNKLKKGDTLSVAILIANTLAHIDFVISNYSFIDEDSDVYKQKLLEILPIDSVFFYENVIKSDSFFISEVLVIYPNQINITYIDKQIIDKNDLPKGVNLNDINYIIDLNLDGSPDLIEATYCIKFTNEGYCDYTGGKIYFKHNNVEWIEISNTKPA